MTTWCRVRETLKAEIAFSVGSFSPCEKPSEAGIVGGMELAQEVDAICAEFARTLEWPALDQRTGPKVHQRVQAAYDLAAFVCPPNSEPDGLTLVAMSLDEDLERPLRFALVDYFNIAGLDRAVHVPIARQRWPNAGEDAKN